MSIKMLYQYPITLAGSQPIFQIFNEFTSSVKPNSFQIRNFTTSPLYVSSKIGVSSTSYEVMIPSNSTRLFTPIRPIEGIYLVSASSGSIILNAFRNDDVKFLDYDQDSAISVDVEIKNDAGNPLPVSFPSATETKLDNLASIKTAVELIDNTISGNEMQVDIVTLPTATETKLDNLASIKTAVELIDNAISGNEMQVDIVAQLPTGTKFIGRTGSNCFSVSASFNRPADTTQYAVNDCISNSVSVPTVLELDLSFFDVIPFQFIKINHVIVHSNCVPTALPIDINAWIYPSTYTIANDNTTFDIGDTTANSSGVVADCSISTVSASNHQARSTAIDEIIQLGSTTSIFVALQSNNAYTPQAGETFLVRIVGELL